MLTFDEAVRENEQLRARLIEAENQFLRESLDFLGQYVDPSDAFRGPDGTLWPEVGTAASERGSNAAFLSEQQLADARNAARSLERTNEFAINGHENRINYIVGMGHTYKVVAHKGAGMGAGSGDPRTAGAGAASSSGAETVALAQAAIDQFVRANRWQQRQQEIVRRRDRDGEVFLRLFADESGMVRVRFVEPDQVYRPLERAAHQSSSFGIETDPDDVETVLGYWIDGALVDQAQIQHRKLGVDRNVKRGVPLFHPVRRNLLRAEKLLQNMATVADIQTAIAMIRRHDRAARTAAETFRTSSASAQLASAGGDTGYFRHYAPGTIIDAPKSTEYEFPAAGLDASRYVLVLQAILRSVASRLVFPEFMLTSDASNANYSSTLVAEGPAVKMFERWQADMAVDDLEVMWHVLDQATAAGRLPRDLRAQVEIQIGTPRVATRDARQEAEVNEVYHRLGVKSLQTIAAEIGLDHAQEQENRKGEGMKDEG